MVTNAEHPGSQAICMMQWDMNDKELSAVVFSAAQSPTVSG